MDATQLRALQTPLREKYRSAPGAALITLKAKGSVEDNAITCKVDKEANVGFQAFRLRFEIISRAPQDKLDQLMKLTERYCVVFQTLKGNAALSASLHNAPPA